MLRGILFSLLFVCYGASAREAGIQHLLQLDERIRSDSMNSWFKHYVRGLDSAQAIGALDQLEQAAKAGNNKIAIATLPYLRGQYYELRLKRTTEARILYKEAIDNALEAGLDYEWAVFTFHLGIFYYFNDNIPEAIECVLRANDKLRQLGYARDKYAGWHLYHIAYIYYHLHNYRESLKYLAEASKHLYRKDEWLAIQIPNTTGLAYSHLGRYDSAFRFFEKAFELAKTSGDSVWLGITEGNKGEIYLQMKEYDKALASLQTSYEYLVRHRGSGTAGTTVRALTAMAEVYVAKKDPDKALAMLQEARQVFLPLTDKTDYWRQAGFYKTMADAYALKSDFSQAYYYKHLGMQVADSIARRDDALRYIYVQQQLESEKHMAQIDVLHAQQRLERQRRNFLLLAFGLLGVIGFMVFNRYRLKLKKDKEISEKENQLLQSEALRMQNNLESAQMLLDQYVENINEKNQLIDGLRAEFARSEQLLTHTNDHEQQLEYIQQLSDATLLTDDEWDRFKELFGKVHKSFFVEVKSKIPDITEAELRLLALIKLNIANKQIARMLGISPASVHTARYRLRKKMALKDDIQLVEMI
jgi:tetratricopeptide (TPR) repeat protein